MEQRSQAPRYPLRGMAESAAMRSLIVLLVLGCTAATTGHAGESEERFLRYELAPFAGYRFGGDFERRANGGDLDLADSRAFALALDLRRDAYSQYELFYARQSTRLQGSAGLGAPDIEVEYLHLGGTLVVAEDSYLAPYIVATVGATRFGLDPAEADDETRFSFSLGAGLRVPVRPRFSLRLEARGFITLVDTDGSFFCESGELGGVCAIAARSSTFIQYEILAGAAFAF